MCLKRSLTFICSTVHISKSTDLTLLICVPIERCMPEHLIHRNTPLSSHQYPIPSPIYLRYSQIPRSPSRIYTPTCKRTLYLQFKQRHAPFRLQSAHTLFSGLFSSSRSTFACLSVVALSCLVDIAFCVVDSWWSGSKVVCLWASTLWHVTLKACCHLTQAAESLHSSSYHVQQKCLLQRKEQRHVGKLFLLDEETDLRS